MKLRISLFFIILFLMATGVQAQFDCRDPYNPFYTCRHIVEHFDYFFYGEIISIEKKNVEFKSTSAMFKAIVKVNKLFKGELPDEITLYLSWKTGCMNLPVKGRFLFLAANQDFNNGQKALFTEQISRPMTDYSAKAVKEVFDNIESTLSNKKEDFAEGTIYEQSSEDRKQSLKNEDADRLKINNENHKPLGNIHIEAISQKDGKVYKTISQKDGKFRIDKIPQGSYKIKLELPADKEQAEPFDYNTDNFACSRKWYIFVRHKSLQQPKQ